MSEPAAESLRFFADRYRLDPAAMSSILSIALSRGGDFAELFFEHRTQTAISWEDQHVKSASRNVAQGVGIRVVKGEAIGYAYTEELDPAAMRRAAETAARIGSGGGQPGPIDATPQLRGRACYSTEDPLSARPAAEKVALLERADRAARAFDPSVARVDASLGDELRYIAIARSDGRVTGDVQPLIRMMDRAQYERSSQLSSLVESGIYLQRTVDVKCMVELGCRHGLVLKPGDRPEARLTCRTVVHLPLHRIPTWLGGEIVSGNKTDGRLGHREIAYSRW